MHLGPHRPALSRLAVRLVLLVALAAASLTLVQCRQVGDRLTGVGVSPLHGNRDRDCLKACFSQFLKDLAAEYKLFKQNLEACGSDSTCRYDEYQRHHDAVEAIWRAYRDCKGSCHGQGGGGGGD